MAFTGFLAVTNRSQVLVAFAGPLLAVTNRTAGSFWPSLGSNKSYCRPILAVNNRTAHGKSGFEPLSSRNGFDGFFWPTPGHNKSLLPDLSGFSVPFLAVTNRTAGFLVALSSPFLAVTNRTTGYWWLFLAHSWP